MTTEEKLLLLKDLPARLPYGVIVDNPNPAGGMWDEVISIDTSTKTVTLLYNGRVFSIDIIKPYLRPMSSMTDDERNEFRVAGGVMSHNLQNDSWAISAFTPEAYDWLNAHHFDYRELIEKGLALEAPEGMYKND